MVPENYVPQSPRWIGACRNDCIAQNGVVSSKHPLIGEAGIKIMKNGGNAVDAAVSAAFMDCVVEPAMNGLGGEGVIAIHLESGKNIIIDYVGRPSKDSQPDMYELIEGYEKKGWKWRNVLGSANRIGHLACTTPGMVAGLTTALELYGTMRLEDVLKPAIKVAEEGFIVGWWTASSIFQRVREFWRFDEWRRIYLHDGRFSYIPYSEDMRNPERLVNKDLAKSLRSIAKEGEEAFYKGWIASAIVEEMIKGGGLISKEDLAAYEPIVHEPELGNYREHEIVYDPTHTGTTMMQILNILEGFDLSYSGFGSSKTIHLVAEAIGLAFTDRYKYMGDPGWIKVPQKGLVSKQYAEKLRERINLKKANPMIPGDPWPYEPENTTALAVADKAGNFVCVNQTLVNSFGCGVVVPGTGICMNNAMYGLNPEPGHANSIDGRKRRIQNVCPTIVINDDEPFMALGAPGGRNIQVSLSQVIVNVVDFGMGIQEAIEAPRITRETMEVYVDNRYPYIIRDELIKMGHNVVWIDQELKSWARPVGVLRDTETRLLHGGVYCNHNGFESIAKGF
ncbi:gamma-glutamyltransferase [Thermoproteota archaeon]